MSPYFVKNFRNANPCARCRRPGRKSLCAAHLAVARLAWRVWAVQRRRAGGCCDCSAAAVPRAGRCAPHRRANFKRLKRWLAGNGIAFTARQKTRVEALVDSGLCRCAARNPLPPGYRRCADCRLLHRAAPSHTKYRPSAAEVRAVQRRRAAARRAKDAEVVKEARRALRGYGVRLVPGTRCGLKLLRGRS